MQHSPNRKSKETLSHEKNRNESDIQQQEFFMFVFALCTYHMANTHHSFFDIIYFVHFEFNIEHGLFWYEF